MVTRSAAGLLQNISRDDKARSVVQQHDGPTHLTNLIFSTQDTAGQVSSIGALVNVSTCENKFQANVNTQILGPDVQNNQTKRQTLKKILSMCLLVGQLRTLCSDLQFELPEDVLSLESEGSSDSEELDHVN